MSKNNSDFFSQKNNWSEIKDRLLSCYLPEYFQKLLASKKPIFYVDCFAGKGRFDDSTDGSPIIALKIRDECIYKSHYLNKTIDCCFIDLNYASDLQKNTSLFSKVNGLIDIRSGKYEDLIVDILKGKHSINVFMYIDPYGIKALDYSLFEKFVNCGLTSIEILINMNSFGFFRDACRVLNVNCSEDEALINLDEIVEFDPTEVESTKQSEELLSSIAGGDYWKDIVKDYKNGNINGYAAEKRFSYEYKQRLRKDFKYVLDMPIRINKSAHPKYRMVHVSNHEDGCKLMATNMLNRSEELYCEIQNQGQGDLFDLDVQQQIVDCNDICKKIRSFLLTYTDYINTDPFLASFYTEYGVICKPEAIYKELRQLEETNELEVLRVPELTSLGNKKKCFTEVRSSGQTVRIKLRKR